MTEKEPRSMRQRFLYHCPPRIEGQVTAALIILFLVLNLSREVRQGTALASRRLQPDGETDHDPLLPLSARDVWGFVWASVGLMLAAGGGIGGGGILVPIYILVMGFSPKHAIPLSNVTVFGGAVANTILNARKRHPLGDRPLVDWDLILVMEPLTIGGALIGANLNKLLPEVVIVFMLVVLLSFTAYTTLRNARKLYNKESHRWSRVETDERLSSSDMELVRLPSSTEDGTSSVPPQSTTGKCSLHRSQSDVVQSPVSSPQLTPLGLIRRRSQPLEAGIGNGDETGSAAFPADAAFSLVSPGLQDDEPLMKLTELTEKNSDMNVASLSSFSDDEGGAATPLQVRGNGAYESGSATSEEERKALEKLLDEEQHVPIGKVIAVSCLFCVVLLINIIKGGGAFHSPLGIECGSLSFWLAEGFMLCWIGGFSLCARSYLILRTMTKENLHYRYMEGDIKWDGRATIVYPSICCLAGLFAGMFGIGGGIVKGPLMLAMEVHPSVASATSACMILFTSFTATSSFAVFGLIVEDYAWVCLTMGFLATLLGQTVMSYLLRRSERHSYIAFSIGIVVLLSAVFMTIESVVTIHATGARSSSGLCTSHLE